MSAPFFAIFQFDAAGGFVSWLFGLAVLGFSIWMVVDCWQRGNATWWIFIILFFQPIGALVYFVTQYWDSTRLEHGLWQRLTIGSRIRDVKARAHYLDTSTAFEELGDLYASIRKWSQAEEAYRAALQRDAGNLDAQVRLGYVLVELGRADESWSLLGPAYQKNPGFDDDKLIRHLARCQAMRGNFVDARNLYEYFLRKHTYTEVQLEYARMLLQAGDRDAARKALEELIRDAQHAPKFAQRRDRRWIREARRIEKTLV